MADISPWAESNLRRTGGGRACMWLNTPAL